MPRAKADWSFKWLTKTPRAPKPRTTSRPRRLLRPRRRLKLVPKAAASAVPVAGAAVVVTAANKAMVRVPLREGRTLHHDGMGHFGAGRVYVRSAPQGTGIIAGGPMRAVFESLGVADVVTKSVGTSNPYNMIRATFEALGDQSSPKAVAQRRGKKIADLMSRRAGLGGAEAQAEAEAVTE